MKKLDIHNQPRLSLIRTFQLTVNGVRYRMFRSVVTMMVITVAIAFLMNSLSETLIKRSMADYAREQIREKRQAAHWVARLSQPGTAEDIIATAANAAPDSAWYRETMGFAELSAAKMESFVQKARQAVRYIQFFERMNYDDRRRLIHTAEGIGIFSRLAQSAYWERFIREHERLLSVRLIGTEEELQAFCYAWPGFMARVQVIQERQALACQQVDEALAGRQLLEVFGDPKAMLSTVIRDAGFIFTDAAAAAVQQQSTSLLQQREMEQRVSKFLVRQVIAARMNTGPEKVTTTMLWRDLFRSRELAAWTLDLFDLHVKLESAWNDPVKRESITAALDPDAKLSDPGVVFRQLTSDPLAARKFRELPAVRDLGVGIDISPEHALSLASERREVAALLNAERLSADVGDGVLGLGPRMGLLLLVSLVVCMVGIANAMLMTVTERFREIATLKCLGALDLFIMTMFVIEACILGIFGGILGAGVGMLIGLGRMRVRFGHVLGPALRFDELALGMLAAILIGIVLAALAAVYPSLKASRLAPMEAMRIE